MNHSNTVDLVGFYGSDISHSLSAWTSTSRDLTEEKSKRIPGLLKMLAEAGHHTPFEKSTLHFLCKTDVCSHIHLLKHRIGVSINGESARYKELKDDKFYVPVDWDESEQKIYIEHMERSLDCYHRALARFAVAGMNRKRAKESARLYLPYGNQLVCDVSFNFRSFMHFVKLRYSTHAQVEIQLIAKRMLELVMDLPENPFRESLEAFGVVRNGQLMGPTDVGSNIAFTSLDETVKPILMSEGSNACE